MYNSARNRKTFLISYNAQLIFNGEHTHIQKGGRVAEGIKHILHIHEPIALTCESVSCLRAGANH